MRHLFCACFALKSSPILTGCCNRISCLHDIVHLYDRDAFMIVSDGRKILGKGF
jgi:uncharacterized membrane-anchored protein YitT (DUF2179 family)